MSASSGLLAKGEKGKSKFQSLDINNLYKSTENEPTQTKGSLLRTKNGMQSLGKVPTARRPPANLPSLKSENSGNEPAVSLVPAGAAGWGSKPGETAPPSAQQSNTVAASSAPPVASAPVAVVTPVVMVPVPPAHEQALHNLMPGPDKSWSAIMAREQTPNFLAHQSPQFQHEFPRLASDGGSAAPGKPVDAQYGPGPSLRPQTEGSWIAGGGRPLSGVGGAGPPGPALAPAPHGPEPVAARTNLGPHPAVAAPMGPGGPQRPFEVPVTSLNLPNAYRPLQHPFMMGPRPGFPGGPMGGMRPRFPYPPGRQPDSDELVTRPIIRDEELNKMDEIARGPGWAANEDIDYNEKLAFSDSEDGPTGDSKKDPRKEKNDKSRGKDDDKERSERSERDGDRRSEERVVDKRIDWGRAPRGYPMHDDRHKHREVDNDRQKLRDLDEERRRRDADDERRKVREEVAAVVQVARQRKEDEAKRFDDDRRKSESSTGSSRARKESNCLDEPKRGERRDWDDHSQKRDLDRDQKRDSDRDQKRDSDHGKYESKRDIDHGKYESKRDSDHEKYDSKRDSNHGKYEKRESEHGKYDNKRDSDHKYENKRESDHKRDSYDREPKNEVGKYERDSKEPKREYDRDSKREDSKRDHDGKRDDHKYEREGGKYERDRDYRGNRDYRQGPRQYNKLPPRLQAQADRMNSQRQTGSPQPAPASNNYDQHWGHGRRYGGDAAEETRDRHTPDTFSDRYKGPHRSYQDTDARRNFDRKERESDSERIPEDNFKKSRENEVMPRLVKETRKDPSEEREAWRVDEERRPQRPDSRDSRTSRDSRNSREDKHERFPPQVDEDRKREETGNKPGISVPREDPVPPREVKEAPAEENKSQPAVTKEEVAPPAPPNAPGEAHVATNDEPKEERVEKSPGQDERQKGNRSTRGSRWGSGSTSSTTYVRNGTRGERRRRVSGGPKPEHESGSSCEGGSELDKGEKEERNRETKRSTDSTGRDGFAPSGQPSRRGRGAARVRGGGSSTAPRRMDGYGPPPVKASFTQNEPPAVEEEEEDPTKQKQAALNAGIVGGAARAAAAAAKPDTKSVPPRMQRSQSQRDGTRGKAIRGARRSGGRSGADGDEAWETMSNSDGEDRKTETRPRRGGGGGGSAGQTSRPPPRPTLNRYAPGSAVVNRSSVSNAESKEKPIPETEKPKDVESDSNQFSTSSQDSRAKKDVPRKDGPKSKPEGGRNGPTGKDRDRPDRRGKPAPLPATAPPAPNPNGPQPLMSQVVNPPPQMKNYSNSTWRQATVLPPRLQKQQDQQRQQPNHEAHDLNKINQPVFPPKNESVQPRENAWDKPLGPRGGPPPSEPVPVDSARGSPASSAGGGILPANKPSSRPDPLLDDSVPPVQTIIFENTNLKAATPVPYTTSLKPAPVRVSKGNEWKAGEELFAKGAELSSGEPPVSEHSMKPQPPLYHTEHGLDLLNTDIEMTEENAADLKHRLAGTKTLWDRNEDEQTGSAVFPASFCQDTTMDASGFGKAVEGVVVTDDCSGLMHPNEVVYSPVSQHGYGMSKHDPSGSSNVCKVKPQQQPVLTSGHSPLGHAGQSPLSPPPFSSAQGPFNYPQYNLQQTGLSGSAAQFSGMPAIPSPPAGHPYSSQPLQASSGLFTPFQLDRSQFSTQYSTPYGLSAGLGGTSSFNQQPLYLPHAAPPTDLFSQFRVQHPSAHTNPNTVLMTSTANSLMSASVKPSSQNIGVIGSKGPAFQQSNQMFIPYDPMQLGLSQSYLSGSGIVQRSAPVQSAAPNFYSNSAAPQSGFYSTSNAGLGQPMASLQQSYNRQGYVNQSTNLQSYSSQPQVHMDIGYRNAGAVGPASYLKSGVGSNVTVSQPDVLASVFNSAPPKPRPQKQMNQPPPQQSPTAATINKFGQSYQNATQLVCVTTPDTTFWTNKMEN